MKSIKGCRQNQVFWVEFMIMIGVLLLIVTMTLVSVGKAHKMSEENKEQLEACMTIQNLLEYCKVNVSQLESCLKNLGAVSLEALDDQSKWCLSYDANWQPVKEARAGTYYIELNIKETPYTHADLVEMSLTSYGQEQIPLLSLEGSVILRNGEAAKDEGII